MAGRIPVNRNHEPLPGRESTGTRVLVVDDNTAVRGFLVKVLRKGGYAVTAAASGTEAADLLGDQDFDLMILDLEMPGLDGFDILKLARPKRLEMRIVAISGYMGGAFLEAARALGAVAAIQKPVTAKDLLAQVEDAIKKPLGPDVLSQLAAITKPGSI